MSGRKQVLRAAISRCRPGSFYLGQPVIASPEISRFHNARQRQPIKLKILTPDSLALPKLAGKSTPSTALPATDRKGRELGIFPPSRPTWSRQRRTASYSWFITNGDTNNGACPLLGDSLSGTALASC